MWRNLCLILLHIITVYAFLSGGFAQSISGPQGHVLSCNFCHFLVWCLQIPYIRKAAKAKGNSECKIRHSPFNYVVKCAGGSAIYRKLLKVLVRCTWVCLFFTSCCWNSQTVWVEILFISTAFIYLIIRVYKLIIIITIIILILLPAQVFWEWEQFLPTGHRANGTQNHDVAYLRTCTEQKARGGGRQILS